ncbi:MAG TPA: YraN family protein [Nitrospiria bacterium]|nr:YraN family protein [Nitrospiria bacterium]
MSLETRAFGKQGEAEAVRFLEGRGYRIVGRNIRVGRGEIDLIAYDGDVLVFIEVKARRGDRYGGASWAVDARKRRQLTYLAEGYMARRRLRDCPCRFDLVLIQGFTNRAFEVDLIRNAFEAGGDSRLR